MKFKYTPDEETVRELFIKDDKGYKIVFYIKNGSCLEVQFECAVVDTASDSIHGIFVLIDDDFISLSELVKKAHRS